MRKPMKVYVWKDCFTDYTSGLGVVIAPSLEKALEFLRKEIGYAHADLAKAPKVYSLSKARAFFVHGGG